MDTQAIFGLQFLLSVLVWSIAAKWLVVPWLDGMSRRHALSWLTLPHAFRHIGMVFLVPGVVAEPLPASFAHMTPQVGIATKLQERDGLRFNISRLDQKPCLLVNHSLLDPADSATDNR